MKPLISLIVPNYNGEKYLKKTLDSIDDQTISPLYFETLIVDDGSTDKSWEILKKWSKNKKNVILNKNKKNSGQPVTRNKAIELSSGKYMALLDSDDLLLKKSIEKSLEFIEKNPWAHYIYSKHKRIDEKEDFLENRPSQEYSFEDLFHYNFVGPLKIFSKEIHKKINGYDPKTPYAQDWDHVLRAAIKMGGENIVQNPEYLYLYRFHSNNISNTKFEERKKMICSFLEKHLEKRGINEKVFWSHKTNRGYNYFDWKK